MVKQATLTGMATRHALSGGLDARQDGGSKTTVAAAVIKSSADVSGLCFLLQTCTSVSEVEAGMYKPVT